MAPLPEGVPPRIAWLGRATGDSALLGGKGAGLDQLIRLGVDTPPGFCLTTEAFAYQLGEEATRLSRADEVDERQRLLAALAAPLRSPLAGELATAVGELIALGGDGAALAVRSSAVGEDGRAASFAGIHETELDLPPDEVDAAVRRCWASLLSDRAVEYRRVRGLSMADASMAVVVQLLVPAEAAAVVFTRHPVTGRDDRIVVNAVRGFGEALVSGEVTPHMAVLDKASLALEEEDGEALTHDALLRLAGIGLALERSFGQPVDIEAALAADRWYILQARPITT